MFIYLFLFLIGKGNFIKLDKGTSRKKTKDLKVSKLEVTKIGNYKQIMYRKHEKKTTSNTQVEWG